MKLCHKCGYEFKGLGQPGPKQECEQCTTDLHSCLNCEFYEPGRANSCRADSDLVRDKERFNYCEEFKFLNGRRKTEPPQKTDARSEMDKLFRKPNP
jgi:hypothetical protein